MTLPAPISDHVQQGLAKLTTPFKGRPLFAAWCRSHLNRKQETEDMLRAFLEAFDLDTCDATRLAIIGKIVGQTPVGTTETFRRLVKVRILVNRTDTTAPTLIKIAMLLFSGPVYYSEGDCSIWIEANGPLPVDTDATTLTNILRGAKMGGVSLNVIAQSEAYEDAFLLGDDGDALIDAPTHGLSDGDADGLGTTAGGYLAGDF